MLSSKPSLFLRKSHGANKNCCRQEFYNPESTTTPVAATPSNESTGATKTGSGEKTISPDSNQERYNLVVVFRAVGTLAILATVFIRFGGKQWATRVLRRGINPKYHRARDDDLEK